MRFGDYYTSISILNNNKYMKWNNFILYSKFSATEHYFFTSYYWPHMSTSDEQESVCDSHKRDALKIMIPIMLSHNIKCW